MTDNEIKMILILAAFFLFGFVSGIMCEKITRKFDKKMTKEY